MIGAAVAFSMVDRRLATGDQDALGWEIFTNDGEFGVGLMPGHALPGLKKGWQGRRGREVRRCLSRALDGESFDGESFDGESFDDEKYFLEPRNDAPPSSARGFHPLESQRQRLVFLLGH